MNIPDGWKLVPIEPTEGMVDAYKEGMRTSAIRNYKAMLAAAPTPPAQENVGMEPVAWLSPNGLTANTKHLFNGKPLYSAEQLAQVQRERDEALLLLKDHVALQLKYQRDRDELLEAAKTVANNIGEFACAMQTQNQADVLTKYASDIFAEIAKTEGRK